MHLERNSAIVADALRFSVLFDFDKSKTVVTYEKFITDVIAPQVKDSSTVIIHGHTDIIGLEEYNMILSQERANEAKSILERAIIKSGKKGVKFVIYGFGADTEMAPFGNKLPEERFYNRTVIIDLLPR